MKSDDTHFVVDPVEELSSNLGQPIFENLIWLTTKEAAQYLRKSSNAIRILVFRKVLRARKFRRRLYFRKCELDAVIETSSVERG
jgi:excisionase family DNA binding protein